MVGVWIDPVTAQVMMTLPDFAIAVLPEFDPAPLTIFVVPAKAGTQEQPHVASL